MEKIGERVVMVDGVMRQTELVHVDRGVIPNDYHCRCEFCTKAIGELRRETGEYYSRLERRKYYAKEEQGEQGHIAKTPLHIARWAVQEFSEQGDWVLDPTMGAGTTAVEAVTQGRNVFGIEIQFTDVINANLKKNCPEGVRAIIVKDDARNIAPYLTGPDHMVPTDANVSLIVNNPPYSGDEGQAGIGKPNYSYKDGLPNLAFLREGKEYDEALLTIYQACVDRLKSGGHMVIGVKDMMRNKKPFMLHQQLAHLILRTGMTFKGAAFLKHHPTTLFINTYEKRYGIPAPMYQTILVFEKPC